MRPLREVLAAAVHITAAQADLAIHLTFSAKCSEAVEVEFSKAFLAGIKVIRAKLKEPIYVTTSKSH